LERRMYIEDKLLAAAERLESLDKAIDKQKERAFTAGVVIGFGICALLFFVIAVMVSIVK